MSGGLLEPGTDDTLPCRFSRCGEEERNSPGRITFARFLGHTSHLSHTPGLSQAALIAHPSREPSGMESFKKRHYHSPRTLQCLSQFAHRCRSFFGNEISDCTFHALKVLAQQQHVRGDFNHFSALYQKFESSLLLRVPLKFSTRRWIERFPG